MAAVVFVAVFGGVNWVKSQASSGKVTVTNWYGNFVESETEAPVGEQALGIIEFPDGIPFSQLASNVLKEKIVRVTSREVASLSWDPIELLPHPGAGFTYDIDRIIAYRKFASESFVFTGNTGNDTGFEVKWADVLTASGLNGEFALGASFQKGFVDGGTANTTASPSFVIWVPSKKFTGNSDGTASISFEPPYTGSASAVYLTASAAFTVGSNTAVGGSATEFFFRIIYRLVNLNF